MILLFVARQLNEGEIMAVQHAFNYIDSGHTATITLEEFVDSRLDSRQPGKASTWACPKPH